MKTIYCVMYSQLINKMFCVCRDFSRICIVFLSSTMLMEYPHLIACVGGPGGTLI